MDVDCSRTGRCRVFSIAFASGKKGNYQNYKYRDFHVIAANERGLAQWRYSVIRQPGAATPDQV